MKSFFKKHGCKVMVSSFDYKVMIIKEFEECEEELTPLSDLIKKLNLDV